MNNFYGFNQEDILPYHKSKHAKRNIDLQKNLKLFAESKQIDDELKKASKENQQKMLFESIASNSYNKRSSNRRTRLAEDFQIRKNLSKKVLTSYLTEMVISGLVFDEYFIDLHKDSIKNEMNNIFTELFNQNILTEDSFINCKNILVNDAYYNLQECINNVIKNRHENNIFTEDVIDNILQEAKKSKDLSDEVAENVKGKVTDTLETEKKISKKKKEEKEKDEEDAAEEADAAESLDTDVDEDPDAGTNTDDEENGEESTDGEESSEDNNEEDLGDADKLDDTDSADGEESSEDTGEDPTADANPEDVGEESSEDNNEEDLGDADKLDDTDSADGEEPSEDTGEDPTADANPEDSSTEGNTDDMSSTGSGELTVTVKTNGTSVTVSANKSESVNYLNLFGRSRYKSKNEKTFFRNILENKLVESVNLLSESSTPISDKNPINMDNVLAESIITYTLLETLHTSRLLELSSNKIISLNKMMNFNNKNK